MNTNISDITLDFVKNYMRIEPDFIDDDAEIQLFMSVAQSFLSEQTHRTIEELNARPSAVAPYLYAVSEFYNNRSITGANVAMNPVFKLMLNGLKKKGIL
jgi:hypothetical protein